MIAQRAMQKRRAEKAEKRSESIKAAKAAAAAEMKERAAQAMASFDADKDGILNKDEIAALVKSMAEQKGSQMLSEEALETVILHCTGARDGKGCADARAPAVCWRSICLLGARDRRCRLWAKVRRDSVSQPKFGLG